ncbi:MAG: glycosyltransferase family 4 protein [Alphaproteobacteria bacterium]|nr:glycosyltransferase family 4 protein [Alphaproteobacteria bacterium]
MRVVVVAGTVRAVERQRGAVVRALAQAGHEVIAVGDPARGGQASIDALAALGVAFEPLGIERHGTGLRKDAEVFAAFLRLYRRLRPDVVLHSNIKPNVYGTLAAAAAGVPHRFALVTGVGDVFSEAGSVRDAAVRQVARVLYRLGVAASEGVIFQNADDVLLFLELGVLRSLDGVSVVHGSGVDMQHFARVPLPKGPPRLLWMGRLLRSKGLPELVEAWRSVRHRAPGAELHLLGRFDPGHPSAVTEEELAAWTADGDVVHDGEASDVRPHLAAASVLVHPSRREGTPLAVLEAMSMGRAIVTTDVPGCRQTIRHGVEGLIVRPDDPGALAAALGAVLDDPARVVRMGEAAHARCLARYAAPRVAATMLAAMGLA